jgi:hypothetical protein
MERTFQKGASPFRSGQSVAGEGFALEQTTCIAAAPLAGTRPVLIEVFARMDRAEFEKQAADLVRPHGVLAMLRAVAAASTEISSGRDR